MQDKSPGLAIVQGQVSQGYRPSQVLLAETSRAALPYLGKQRGSELYTSTFCKIGRGRLGPVLKASTQRQALPAAARLGGSATVPNSSGVSRGSLLHPPPRAPLPLPAARGPPLRARMPLGCQGPTGGVVPGRRALAPWTRVGSLGADGEKPRGRPAPGALWPGRPLPGEARGPPARSAEPQPMPSETRPAGAASARHSTVSALRARAPGARRLLSC